VWHLPGPETVTTRALLDLVAGEVNHPVGVRNVPKIAMRAVGLVNPMMRGLAEMSYEFEQPFVLDTSKYESTFDTAATPLATAITNTVAWYRNKASSQMTMSEAPTTAELSPSAAWSQRVRRVGGFIQLAFAAFWLVRGALIIGGVSGTILTGVAIVIVVAVLIYGIRVTARTGRRPTGPEAKRIERSVNTATVIELVASLVLPVIVIAAGHSDWVLPSIAITIGPLLLWLDHLLHIPRYRPVGWALTVGPFILIATLSGSVLAAITGLAAGILLLGTAAAGFHDLAGIQPPRSPKTVRLSPPAQ
jgi:hypothetical protein